jgi:hypothetical protein
MTEEQKNVFNDNTYYDQTGKQILVGDLLKVYHYGSGNKTRYMYHVVVMEETPTFSVMAVSGYRGEKQHCRMYVCTDNRVYKTAKIIDQIDWETKRKRIKVNKDE